MLEVHAHVWLVVSIIEVVHPTGFIRINVYDAGMKEIPRTAERAGKGFVDDVAVIVDIGGILGDHNDLVHIDLYIGVTYAFARIQAVFAQGGTGVVIPFVFVDHLLFVQTFFAGDGVYIVNAFDGTQLIFVRPFPGNRTAPVQMRGDGFAVTVFRDLKQVVATVSRVGQAFADNGVAHPVNELAVFGVGYFRFVHPERVKRNSLCFRVDSP